MPYNGVWVVSYIVAVVNKLGVRLYFMFIVCSCSSVKQQKSGNFCIRINLHIVTVAYKSLFENSSIKRQLNVKSSLGNLANIIKLSSIFPGNRDKILC